MTNENEGRSRVFEWSVVVLLVAVLVLLAVRGRVASGSGAAVDGTASPAVSSRDAGLPSDAPARSVADASASDAAGTPPLPEVELVDFLGAGVDAPVFAPPPARPLLASVSLSEGLPVAGQWRGASVLADLDGDRDADLVTSIRRLDASTPGEGLSVFLNDGDGRWHAAVDGLRRDMGYGGSAVADVDGDGHADIAFSGHDVPPHVFLGDGNGRWRLERAGIDARQMCSDVALGDVDRDGLVDLAVLGFHHDGGGLLLYAGVGGGTFVRLPDLLPPGVYGAQVAMPDLDGDGHPEIAATTSLGPKVFRFDGESLVDMSAGLPEPEIGGSDLGLDARDLDGDGFSELLVTGMVYPGHDPLCIYRWDGSSWVRWGEGLPEDESFFDGRFAHVEGGDVDWIVLAGKAGIQLVRGTREGVFESVGRLAGTEGVFNVATGDVDGDGRDEVVFIGLGGVRVLSPVLPAEAEGGS
ncbi:MAG: VCBS repeat-containing protein [Planctomycetes bacterium]|nr:VCBS repeat-containing protein [Planctomycetota bacterium]